MQLAIELARKGEGKVNPNPMVGAVIVRDGIVIGEGYHEKYGEGHAEVNAFKSLKEDPSEATMYVTLEPCSHYGKTPPCVDKIVENKNYMTDVQKNVQFLLCIFFIFFKPDIFASYCDGNLFSFLWEMCD